MRQIMSFDELPKPKRPPEAIWDNSVELETWFDKIYQHNETSGDDSGTPDSASIFIDDSDIG